MRWKEPQPYRYPAIKHMKKYGILIFCFLFVPELICLFAASAQDNPARLFSQGNSEYQKGDYSSAEQHYRQILDSGMENGSLYYNLGNACFKQKHLGDAIYYWEKARQKMPADPDIRGNLELANRLLVDRIEAPADPFLVQIMVRVQGWLTIAEQSKLVLILFMAVNILLAIYWLIQSPRFASYAIVGCLAAGLLFILAAGSLSWKIYLAENRKEGVVIEQKVDIRSGPGTENITIFTIHEGLKVRILGSSSGWHQINLPNGWSGWLPQSYLRIL
jgi:tetratricopeptide (TPR) repeat protein